jgi:enamine deaminase RidA (YjgF/YER057c/UK114 family)
MTNRILDPDTMAAPIGLYSHGVEVPAGARLIFVSGQLGVAPDGTLAEGIEAQTELAWQNMQRVLEAGGMTFEDLVKVNTFIVDPDHADIVRAVRRRFLPGEQPASTLVAVRAMARPEWLIELEGVAARRD